MQLNIGYPDCLSDDKELDSECIFAKRDRWPGSPLEVNAEFLESGNGSKISKYFYHFQKSQSLKCVSFEQ